MGMDRPIKKHRIPIKWIIIVNVSILAVAAVVYQIRFTSKTPVVYAKKEDLRICEISRGTFQEFINIIGRVVSSRTSYIGTLETGTVKELMVEEGDLLSSDQVLLVLENTQLETALTLKKSQITEKHVAMEMEKIFNARKKLDMKEELLDLEHKIVEISKEYHQTKKLFDATKAISKNDLEKQERSLKYWQDKKKLLMGRQKIELNRMEFESRKNEIGLGILLTEKKRLEQRLGNLVIRVATEGLLTKLDASVGEIKSAGSRIAVFDIIHPLKLEAEIDEYYLNKVNINYEGTFKVSQPNRGILLFTVFVTMIHPEVQNNMFTVDLKFKDNQSFTFIIGQTFDIELALGSPQDVIKLKKGPFIQDTGGNWVYVINKSETKATKRRVKAGRQNPDYLEIIQGLAPGEKVIISRYDTYENLEEITIH